MSKIVKNVVEEASEKGQQAIFGQNLEKFELSQTCSLDARSPLSMFSSLQILLEMSPRWKYFTFTLFHKLYRSGVFKFYFQFIIL